MKFHIPRPWRRFKKSSTPPNTSPNPVVDRPQESSEKGYARQAVENVRNLSAATGEEFGLTILDRDEEVVAWMNFSGIRMSSPATSPATSEHRKAMSDGYTDWRSAEVAVLKEGEGSEPSSATSDEAPEESLSGTKTFGKSGIEISETMVIRGPRPRVNFRYIDWNPPTVFRLGGDGDAIGPAGEVLKFGI